MLPASSAVRKNSAERQRRITNSHAGISRIVSTAPGSSPRYWKAIGTAQLTWSSPLAPTSRRHASSSGWVKGASTSCSTASPNRANSTSPISPVTSSARGRAGRAGRCAPVGAADAPPPATTDDVEVAPVVAPVASAITSPP